MDASSATTKDVPSTTDEAPETMEEGLEIMDDGLETTEENIPAAMGEGPEITDTTTRTQSPTYC
jgi:hypothetical protein